LHRVLCFCSIKSILVCHSKGLALWACKNESLLDY
jgi:hypothetical protein